MILVSGCLQIKLKIVMFGTTYSIDIDTFLSVPVGN